MALIWDGNLAWADEGSRLILLAERLLLVSYEDSGFSRMTCNSLELALLPHDPVAAMQDLLCLHPSKPLGGSL